MSPAEIKTVEDRIVKNKERLKVLNYNFPDRTKLRSRYINRTISEIKNEIHADEQFLSLLKRHK